MQDQSTEQPAVTFTSLGLDSRLLKALDEVGYESPSPIQAMTIPLLLDGNDVLGQAQTGTGKTAAFALPLLQKIDTKLAATQSLVLAPTRELAIQVAEAIGVYARYLKGFHVLPVYGGQDYSGQIRALRRGAHVVVGTPGRLMDHIRRGTLQLDSVNTLVLDEADEMLRMGFIEDVEWILSQVPADHQTALFSATMPAPIRRIAQQHLNAPHEITIKVKTTTADTIRQRYVPVKGVHKLDALTRILEAEEFDAMLVFVRTRTATVELAEKLAARGFASASLNGDMSQQIREKTVSKLKKGKLDILVATDVAARGLDVERVSHVINYDVPHDTESYVHRIGRTGRAGRKGDAILFVAPREKRMLKAIERATRKTIEVMALPTTELITSQRIARFKDKLTQIKSEQDLTLSRKFVTEMISESGWDLEELSATLAWLAQSDQPLLQLNREIPDATAEKPYERHNKNNHERTSERNSERARERKTEHSNRQPDAYAKENRRAPRPETRLRDMEPGMERYRIEVGHNHEVKPGNIVGAIANEAGLESQYIGRITIFDDYSVVDLPDGMPAEVFDHLRETWVAGRKLNICRFEADSSQVSKGRSGPRKPAHERAAPRFKDKGRKKKANAESHQQPSDRKKFSKEKGPKAGESSKVGKTKKKGRKSNDKKGRNSL